MDDERAQESCPWDKGCENRKNLKNFKNVEFQPIKLKENTGDEWVGNTLPPAPLHNNLLGPGNDVLEKMEEIYDEQMELFYKVHCLKTRRGRPRW